MDPIPSSLPVSDSSDSDVESGGEPPSSEGLASSSESRFVYTTILERFPHHRQCTIVMLYDNKFQLLILAVLCCLVSSAVVFPSESSLDMDSSNSGGAEGERRERLRKKRQEKRKRRWLVRAELDHAQRKRLRRGRIVRFPLGEQGKWVTVLSHQICTLPCPGYRDKG